MTFSGIGRLLPSSVNVPRGQHASASVGGVGTIVLCSVAAVSMRLAAAAIIYAESSVHSCCPAATSRSLIDSHPLLHPPPRAHRAVVNGLNESPPFIPQLELLRFSEGNAVSVGIESGKTTKSAAAGSKGSASSAAGSKAGASSSSAAAGGGAGGKSGFFGFGGGK